MMWNSHEDVGLPPLRVLYVTSAPDMPRMRHWLSVLAATLKDDGNILVVACPDGSLSEAALVEDDAGQMGYVYASIRGWSDLAGWSQWMTLMRRLRPHSVHLAADLDMGTAARLALATRLVWPAALLVEARGQGLRRLTYRSRSLRSGLSAWLLYRILPAQVLCADAHQAAELIQAWHMAPARISLVRGAAAEPDHSARPAQRATRGAREHRGARTWRRAPRAADHAALRARHIQALYQLLRPRAVSGAPAVAQPQIESQHVSPRPAWHPSGAARQAATPGQGRETAAVSGRELVLSRPLAMMTRVMHGTDAR